MDRVKVMLDGGDLEKLVDGARRGENDSLAAVFDHFYDGVYRFAYVRLGSVADAEEAAGETFTQMVRSIRKFKWQGSTFAAWLFRIARNVVADEHRRRSRRGEDLHTDVDHRAVSPGADEQVVAREEAAELRAMLGTLPAEQRQVLELRFAAGLGTEEIAQVMDKSAGAVRIQQMRALSSLRRGMEVSSR
jgi:RNA polymerase sigma-70 factor, ECF subfamily